MRKLATIRTIDAIDPIPDADAIEVATVGGWKVVVKKGEYQPGDTAIYVEIDSWVPHDLAPFLSKGQEPKEHQGVVGNRLRTVRLRGQISQGLLLPVNHVVTHLIKDQGALKGSRFSDYVGHDVSEALGIIKYEPPIPACLAGEVKGAFPSTIPKTDQERVQNLTNEMPQWIGEGGEWEVTEKLDGSSMTVFYDGTGLNVCSRNLNLKETEGNTLWAVARNFNLEGILANETRRLALQGELMGEGVQGNRLGIKGHRFYIFDIYDVDAGHYLSPPERQAWAAEHNLDHVPVLETVQLDGRDWLAYAEGKTAVPEATKVAEREGVVLKRTGIGHQPTFKAISNRFLIKGGE